MSEEGIGDIVRDGWCGEDEVGREGRSSGSGRWRYGDQCVVSCVCLINE